jgi:phosphatidylserine decarboxylase
MTIAELIRAFGANENVNFLLTNRIPRRAVTRFMGWFSKIENPLVRRLSIAVWRLFCDVDLSDAAGAPYRSLHEAFTRSLRPGARGFDRDPDILCSPSDGIVGQCGRVEDGTVLQAKGFPYLVRDLLLDDALAARYRNGSYVTLRLTAAMYHRFHSPTACTVQRVRYLSGDAWNVNPVALERIQRLYCRNERATIECRTDAGTDILLVPVAAILVASIRLTFVDVRLHLRYQGPNTIPCDQHLDRGEEMGWFEHGSTIIVFVPPGLSLASGVAPGTRVRAGQALLTGLGAEFPS